MDEPGENPRMNLGLQCEMRKAAKEIGDGKGKRTENSLGSDILTWKSEIIEQGEKEREYRAKEREGNLPVLTVAQKNN